MEIFRKILLAIRVLGLRKLFNMYRYSVRRDRMERYIRAKGDLEPTYHPGELKESESFSRGVRIHFTNAELEIFFVASDFVRVTWQPGSLPFPYALAQVDWPEVDTNFQKSGSDYISSSTDLKVVIDQDGGLCFRHPDGTIIRKEQPPEREGDRWRQRVYLRPEEVVYGLGERVGGLNLRGGRYRMWNSEIGGSYGQGTDPLYLTIPVYMCIQDDGGTLVFHENSFDGSIAVEDLITTVFEGGAHRYYVAVGKPDRLLERYTHLTGHSPLPPRWALGYHQCRWGYKSEKDIREVLAGFREHDLPLDAIHLDIDYMDGYRVFTVNESRFPDLPSLAKDLLSQGVRLVTILDPGVKVDPNYELYRDGLTKGVFCTLPDGEPVQAVVWPGWCVFPDFSDPDVRAWWGTYYDRLIEAGVAGFWHDMNEPSAFATWGDFTIPLTTQHELDGIKGDHRQAHNLYGLLMNRAGFEALRRVQPDRRPWIVSRSGWAGLQRYAWSWTGDTESTWEMLRRTISTVLNLGLSGIPYTGPDIGGFGHRPSAELYTRWFQLAAFLPFFRTHSAIGTPPREPWAFGEPTLSIVRKFLHLRYRLLPYIYTLSWEASQRGYPLVRPLFWPAAIEPDLFSVDDAFLLGDSLLIAPIVQEGALSRTVRLPKGHWFDYWDDTEMKGPAMVEIEAPIDCLPILIAAGSVLPMEEEDGLYLHIYPPNGGIGSSRLYSDAGDGYGPSRLDSFQLVWDDAKLDLFWRQEGDYPFPFQNIEIHLHGPQCTRAWVDGVEVDCVENRLQVGLFERVSFLVDR